MKKVIFFAIFFCCTLLYAQSAHSLDTILNTKNTTWEHLTYLIQAQQGAIPDQETESTFAFCKEARAFPKDREPQETITFAQTAGFLMRYFNVRGGFLYEIGKSDRYAFRFLKNQGLIDYEIEPDKKIDGITLVNLVGDFSNLFLVEN